MTAQEFRPAPPPKLSPYYDRRSSRLTTRAGFALLAALFAGLFLAAMLAGSSGGWTRWHWLALGVVAILTSGSLSCYALMFLIEAPHRRAAQAHSAFDGATFSPAAEGVAVSQCHPDSATVRHPPVPVPVS
jgi:hypothetical protein